jgi:hypothetical protein
VARSVVDAWLVEEQGSEVIRVVNQVSVMEANAAARADEVLHQDDPALRGRLGRRRAQGLRLRRGLGTTDEITIVARKFGKVLRLAEEDLEDELVDILNEKKVAWGNAYAITIDNACLATNGRGQRHHRPVHLGLQGGPHRGRGVGYTANANYVATAGTARR